MVGSASVASIRSERSSKSRSSGASLSSVQSKKSISRRSISSTGGESLQDGLERIEGKASTASSSSVSIQRKSSQSVSSTRSHRSTSSRRSSASKSISAKLDRIGEKTVPRSNSISSVPSATSSWRSPYESSTRHSSSAASVVSSSSTCKVSKNRKSSSGSVSSVVSHHTSISTLSTGGQHARGVDYLNVGNYSKAILAFTKAIQTITQKSNDDRGYNEKQQRLATFYGYRCEALYDIGAYVASKKDARSSLEYESQVGGDKNKSSWFGGIFQSSENTQGELHHERGIVLRCKVLCSLGYSLLRQGDNVNDAMKSFEEAKSVAKKALDGVNDNLPAGGKGNNIEAVISLKETIKLAKDGLSLLSKYETLKTKIDTGSYKRGEYIKLLDDAIEIAPAAVDWHVRKVKYLIGRKRWFAVANHCEQVAAKTAKLEGVFSGDLADINPYFGIPSLKELNADFFTDNQLQKRPSYLRTLSSKATCDAVFRLPDELLPYYLRSLRLEERYEASMLACKALQKLLEERSQSNDKSAESNNYTFFDNEFDKLERTIKLKEEADKFFTDGHYDRAVTLYGDCLSIDCGEEWSRNRSILKTSRMSSCTKPNSEGGRLHAVLHSNRAACFAAMGQHDDAIKECSHAIHIHSMYTKALLRRARCFLQTGQREKARADFNRFISLVIGSRDHPYPPYNQGSACYFDMPSEVSEQKLRAVKSEFNQLGGLNPMGRKESKMMQKFTSMVESLCCNSTVIKSQVVTPPPSQWLMDNNTDVSKSRGDSHHSSSDKSKRRVSFLTPGQAPDPPNLCPSPSLFDNLLDTPKKDP